MAKMKSTFVTSICVVMLLSATSTASGPPAELLAMQKQLHRSEEPVQATTPTNGVRNDEDMQPLYK